jgi:hypothetical protein
LVVAGLSVTFAIGAVAFVNAQQAPAAPAQAQAPAPEPPSLPPAEMPAPVTPVVSGTAPTPDPRPNLKAGRWDAAQAAWNMGLLSTSPPQGKSLGATHSDLAFSGNLVIQGNYNGFDIYDISNPSKPALVQKYLCPASQNDVSVYRNLVFMSSEATNSRADCGFEGVPEPISKLRVRGIRVFDISDITNPKLVTTVQTCRGSHTHTVVRKAGDDGNVYIYVSGSAGVRSAEEVPGCEDGDIDNPNTARFRIEVIKVPLGMPGEAAIVSSPRIFENLPVAPRNEERNASDQRDREAAQAAAAAAGRGGQGRGGPGGPGGRGPQGPPRGPNQCHDITVYGDIGLAGGACGGLGLLLDISDPVNPKRIDEVADPNMSFWHSATFNNDGTKVLFSDEWGGGSQPRCRATDKYEWGSNALFTIDANKKMKFASYYKLPAAQSSLENCVAHNGSVIPIPGRDVMVQSWYQGGLSVFDWTDIAHPKEIAYFDRGPVDANRALRGRAQAGDDGDPRAGWRCRRTTANSVALGRASDRSTGTSSAWSAAPVSRGAASRALRPDGATRLGVSQWRRASRATAPRPPGETSRATVHVRPRGRRAGVPWAGANRRAPAAQSALATASRGSVGRGTV